MTDQNQNSDILVKIPDDQLPKLAALYQERAPWAPHLVSFVQTQIKWKKSDKYKDVVTIYSPNNSWEKDGTIISISRLFCLEVVVFTLDETCTNLYKGLKATTLIQYNERTLFAAVHEKHVPTVEKILKEANIEPSLFPNFFYAISPEEAKNFTTECPPDVYVGRLDLSASKDMSDLWPHRFRNSDKYLESYIEINGGYGVYLKSTNEVVAWILKAYFGHLGVLQTKDEHKRKGYASLLVKVLSKEIAEDGHWPLATILQVNQSSISMFEKLGFRRIGACTYFLIE